MKGWSNARSYFSFVVSAICYPLLSQMTDLDKESIAIVADIHGTSWMLCFDIENRGITQVINLGDTLLGHSIRLVLAND